MREAPSAVTKASRGQTEQRLTTEEANDLRGKIMEERGQMYVFDKKK